jgi:hypothetical protein
MALLNRASGMQEWFPGRNIYATGILVGLASGFISGSWLFGLLAGVAMYVYRLPGWYASLDMGTVGGTVAGDFAIMACRSMMFGIPFLVSAFFYGNPLIAASIAIVSGIGAALGYYTAWHTPAIRINPKDPTVISELLAGAALGASLVAYLLIK